MDKNVVLNNGVIMPRVGFGTFGLNDPRSQVIEALNAGYRLIDTALDYDNEVEVGKGIKESGIKREDIFLTTKIWFRWHENHEGRRQALECMQRLGVDYLDMCMIHWPFNDYYAAYRDLIDLYKEGKIRCIGVCNFNSDRLIDLISFNEIKPQVNQIETHVYCQRIDEHKWMNELGVTHQAYSALGAGRINDLLDNEVLIEISKKYNKNVSQICLRYLLQKDISILTRTNNLERLKQNIDLFDFNLLDEDLLEIEKLDRKQAVIGRPEDPNKVKRAIETYR